LPIEFLAMLTTVGIVFFCLFVFALLVQLYYFLFVFTKLAFRKIEEPAEINEPVSVIMCAKNEARNLHKNIPIFFTQDYPEYELVVVNDCSSDESEDILEEFERKYPNLHVVNLKEDEIKVHDKKLALTLGIKGAKHELLLLTDADCLPHSNQWIKEMVRNFNPQTEIVLGYGPYKKTKGFLNRLIRFDAFFIGLQYLSHAIKGNPYMGIGRNLAYRKSLFFRNKGFATHYHIKSGDDDIFINRVAKASNTRIELSKESFTYSEPKKNFKEWFRQKRRHITTAKYYKSSDKFSLGMWSFTQYLFFISFIVLIVIQFNPIVAISIVVFRLLIQMLIFKKSMDKLGESDLLLFAPFCELFLLFYYPMLVMGNLVIKENKWK